jgi:hypothetical protein
MARAPTQQRPRRRRCYTNSPCAYQEQPGCGPGAGGQGAGGAAGASKAPLDNQSRGTAAAVEAPAQVQRQQQQKKGNSTPGGQQGGEHQQGGEREGQAQHGAESTRQVDVSVAGRAAGLVVARSVELAVGAGLVALIAIVVVWRRSSRRGRGPRNYDL